MAREIAFLGLLVALMAGCASQTPVQPSSPTTSAVASTQSLAPNQQLVFQDRAGTGTAPLAGGGSTPFGFWIWCQPTSANAYGQDCTGSMYFYALGITTGVNGGIVQANGGYTVTVSSTPPNGAISGCTFTLTTPFSPGATNSVTLNCTSPAVVKGTDNKVAINLAPSS